MHPVRVQTGPFLDRGLVGDFDFDMSETRFDPERVLSVPLAKLMIEFVTRVRSRQEPYLNMSKGIMIGMLKKSRNCFFTPVKDLLII